MLPYSTAQSIEIVPRGGPPLIMGGLPLAFIQAVSNQEGVMMAHVQYIELEDKNEIHKD